MMEVQLVARTICWYFPCSPINWNEWPGEKSCWKRAGLGGLDGACWFGDGEGCCCGCCCWSEAINSVGGGGGAASCWSLAPRTQQSGRSLRPSLWPAERMSELLARPPARLRYCGQGKRAKVAPARSSHPAPCSRARFSERTRARFAQCLLRARSVRRL